MHTSKRQRIDGSQAQQLRDDTSTGDEVTKRPLSRKEQNRVSQEKSRARKAEHASLLEAELRLMKYSPDAQVSALLDTIKVLLNENARLRSLVGTLSSFIGSGLGGLVARVGLTEEGVQATANEGYYDLLKREAIHLDATAQSKQAEGTVSQSAGSSSSSSACSSNHSDNCASFPSRSTSRSSHMPQTASAQITVTHSARPLALVGPAVRPSKIASVEKSTSSPPRTVDPSLYTTRFSSSEIDPAQCNHGTNLYSTLSYPPDMLPTISPTDSCTISRASHHFATSSGHQTLPLELDLDLPLFNTNFIDQG